MLRTPIPAPDPTKLTHSYRRLLRRATRPDQAASGKRTKSLSQEDSVLAAPARVLIVDRSLDSREILRTLLARCGTETVEASTVRRGVDLLRSEQPDLIVLDADDACQAAPESTDALASEAAGANTPIVVLGTFQLESGPRALGHGLAKPYHYGQLLRKIEGLLGKSA